MLPIEILDPLFLMIKSQWIVAIDAPYAIKVSGCGRLFEPGLLTAKVFEIRRIVSPLSELRVES